MGRSRGRAGGLDRIEPAGMTVLDLAALVLGAAVLASLHWWSRDALSTFGRPAPTWYAALVFFREASSKACLALVPVMLARRAQFGGLLRPAELLAASFGLPQLALAAQHWPILGLIERDGGMSLITSLRAYLVFHVALAVVGLVGVATFAAGRRWPGWARSAALLAAFLGLQGGGTFLVDWTLRVFVGDLRLDSIALVLTFQIVSVYSLLFEAVPAVAAVRSFRHRARAPTWLERAGAGLALASFLAARATLLAQAPLTGFPSGFWRSEAIEAATVLLVVLISVPIVRRIGPSWDRAAKLPCV